MNPVFQILEKHKNIKISESVQKYYEHIGQWEDWWKGYVEDFHIYHTQSVEKFQPTKREMYKLGMAKKVCEDWANLLLNEKTFVILNTGNEAKTKELQTWLTGDAEEQNGGILGDNDFWKNGNEMIEKEFAKGTSAITISPKKAKAVKDSSGTKLEYDTLKLNFIDDADNIIPLTVVDKKIVECVFASEYLSEGNSYVYLEFHRQKEAGNAAGPYIITNEFYQSDGSGSYAKVPNPDGIVEAYEMPCKSFAIIKPMIKNNFDGSNQMGISVFANAIDQLKACDIAYDNFVTDFVLGKKKVFINQDIIATKEVISAGDRVSREPDIKATVESQLFMSMGTRLPNENQLIYEFNPTLRVEENKKGVQFALDVLSSKVGFGQRRYSFEAANMTTATEVKTSNKDLIESVAKQRIGVQDFLDEIVKSMLIIGKNKLGLIVNPDDVKISIRFDDSMFSDEESERLQFLQEIRDGVRQKWEYRVKFFGEDEKTAKKMVAEEENGINFEDEE